MKSSYTIALHQHQPLIPAGPNGEAISNLQYMFEHQGEGDNHNAGVFKWCYERMGEFVPELLGAGKKPRCMMDYSGNLLWELAKNHPDSLEKLRNLAQNHPNEIEWLGTAWGHAVAPSTPPADYRLHVKAWRIYFEKLFGAEALGRVKGYSPSEMALPNDPDVAYEFVKTLREEGFEYVLIQEHSVELPDGGSLQQRYIPHRLVCKNTKGDSQEIVALIKTQGSDTKLVAQMQPYYEAKTRGQVQLAGKTIPENVAQIADGENGGVMMNEFPPKFKEVINELGDGHGEVQALNGSEYLKILWEMGITPADLPACQPIHQKAFFDSFDGDIKATVERCKQADHRFHMEGGTWTDNLSWVHGYDELLGDMAQASIRFHKKYGENLPADPTANDDLFNLLCAQTSCFRYWGEGRWPDFGREFCRRVCP